MLGSGLKDGLDWGMDVSARQTRRFYEQMTLFADSARCRLLSLLEEHELPVSDLCQVLQLPQSTVSRHLKALHDQGWVGARPDGTRRLYWSTAAEREPAAQELWRLARGATEDSSAWASDRRRLQSVLARARSRTLEFFEASGSRWDTLRDEMFGSTLHLEALLGLLPADWRVADLGCGTGAVSEALAPFVREVVGVDNSAAMRQVARQRTRRFGNVVLQHGELEALPLETASLDAATLILVLHHLEQPGVAVREAARCLRQGGRLLAVDMLPHDRTQYRQEMGHVWLGFSEDEVRSMLQQAGFRKARFQVLPPAPQASGPNLFAVSAIHEKSSTTS